MCTLTQTYTHLHQVGRSTPEVGTDNVFEVVFLVRLEAPGKVWHPKSIMLITLKKHSPNLFVSSNNYASKLLYN